MEQTVSFRSYFPAAGKGQAGPRKNPYQPTRYHASAAETEKNRQVMDLLLPLVSHKIDACGGVKRVADLTGDPEVKALLEQIPVRLPRSLSLILTQWGDFFINLPYGLVGNSTAYETGMIRSDGSLEPAYASAFLDEKGDPRDIANPYNVNKKYTIVDLTKDADRLWKCSVNLENDTDLKLAFKLCEETRRHIRGEDGIAPEEFPGGIPWSGAAAPNPKKLRMLKAKGKGPGIYMPVSAPCNLAEEDRTQRKEKILHRIVEILKRSPNKTKNMCLLASDTTIRELKKGAISKFVAFLQEFPTMFRIINIEGTPQYNVILLDGHVPILKVDGGHVSMSSEVYKRKISEAAT